MTGEFDESIKMMLIEYIFSTSWSYSLEADENRHSYNNKHKAVLVLIVVIQSKVCDNCIAGEIALEGKKQNVMEDSIHAALT